jgi:MFS family permease
MIIPELPEYLDSMGGGPYKGLIIGLFTVTAMFSRPFSGKLADSIGRIPIIVVGSVVCFICSLLYPVLATVVGLLSLRFMHGFSTGFTPTGQTAYLADIIPIERRGEGMGILGTASMLGMAGGAALGGVIGFYFGLNPVFFCSAAFALISIVILAGLKETLVNKQKPHLRLLKIRREDLFEPRVIAPSTVMLLTAFAFGTLMTLIADYSALLGIKNKGLLLTAFTVASFSVRFVGGKFSDVWGRKKMLMVSVTLMMISMFILAMGGSVLVVLVGVVLYGFAQGITSPTLLAWSTDLSDPERKGRGVGSLYIFMELGIGLGAVISGAIYNDKPENLFWTFLVCGLLSLLAIVYLLGEKSSRKYSML